MCTIHVCRICQLPVSALLRGFVGIDDICKFTMHVKRITDSLLLCALGQLMTCFLIMPV